uniref:Uncharacterized protein n=1 Tax=Anguilla anguilla TaxID=7936 RepID=A0A0E9W7T1_ANGAN
MRGQGSSGALWICSPLTSAESPPVLTTQAVRLLCTVDGSPLFSRSRQK